MVDVPGIMDPKYLAVEFCVFHNAISYIIWALTHKVSHRAFFFDIRQPFPSASRYYGITVHHGHYIDTLYW